MGTGRWISWVSLLLLLLGGSGAAVPAMWAQSLPVLACRLSAPQVTVGSEVDLIIEVRNVQDLFWFGVTVVFDPEQVEVVDADPNEDEINVRWGTFLVPEEVYFNEANNVDGNIEIELSQLAPTPGRSGSGELAIARLRSKAEGSAAFTLEYTFLYDSEDEEMSHTVENCQLMVAAAPSATPLPSATLQPTLPPTAEAPTATPVVAVASPTLPPSSTPLPTALPPGSPTLAVASPTTPLPAATAPLPATSLPATSAPSSEASPSPATAPTGNGPTETVIFATGVARTPTVLLLATASAFPPGEPANASPMAPIAGAPSPTIVGALVFADAGSQAAPATAPRPGAAPTNDTTDWALPLAVFLLMLGLGSLILVLAHLVRTVR